MSLIGHTILDLETAKRFVDVDYVSARSLERAKMALQVYRRLFSSYRMLRIAAIDETGGLTPLDF